MCQRAAALPAWHRRWRNVHWEAWRAPPVPSLPCRPDRRRSGLSRRHCPPRSPRPRFSAPGARLACRNRSLQYKWSRSPVCRVHAPRWLPARGRRGSRRPPPRMAPLRRGAMRAPGNPDETDPMTPESSSAVYRSFFPVPNSRLTLIPEKDGHFNLERATTGCFAEISAPRRFKMGPQGKRLLHHCWRDWSPTPKFGSGSCQKMNSTPASLVELAKILQLASVEWMAASLPDATIIEVTPCLAERWRVPREE